MFDKGMISYYEFIIEIKKIINFKGKIKKAKNNDFVSAAPNPLRVAMKSKKGGTGIFGKKQLENILWMKI